MIGSRNIASGFSAAFARAWTATSASCSIGHPAWTHNLLAHPVASVNWRGRDIPVTTRLLTGPERTTARRTPLAFWPPYAVCQDRVERQIRIFRLEALPAGPGTTDTRPPSPDGD